MPPVQTLVFLYIVVSIADMTVHADLRGTHAKNNNKYPNKKAPFQGFFYGIKIEARTKYITKKEVRYFKKLSIFLVSFMPFCTL
jgi:hypothetical protein